MNKPIKPNITIPESFAKNGVKTDFDSDLIASGFDDLKPDVLAGDNLNKFIDDTYKGLNYALNFGDYIDEKVSKSGDTMTGDLTINRNDGHFKINGSGWKGLTATNPEADITATDQTDKQGARVISYDKNNAIMGFLQTYIDKNGAIVTGLNAQRTINGELIQSSILIGVDKQGKTFANVITPPEDDKSLKIATTAWVRKQASKDGFPSNKNVVLTLGATPENHYYVSEHVAPANGWFWLLWNCNGSNDYVQMRNKDNIYRFQVPVRGEVGYYSFMLPFKKGETCRIAYEKAPSSKSDLRFLYSEGNQ